MISRTEKIAYGLGDTASNIIFQSIMMFLLIYYTDVVGLAPAAVGTMFLLVRVIDAITDPIMGIMADNTRSRFGRFRPFLLWLALPFALVSVLAFTSPQSTPEFNYLYAFVTYTLLMLVYTAINIPYSALGAVLTTDHTQRVSIQSYRFVFAMAGGLLVTLCTLPLVNWLGHGNNAVGYQRAMMVLGSLGAVLFLICFFFTTERSQPTDDEPKPGFRDALTLIWQNDQLKVLCIAAFCLLSGQVLRATLAVYYVKYVLEQEALTTWFIALGMTASLLGCACAPLIAKRVCKIKAYRGLQLLAALCCVVHYFVPTSTVALSMVCYMLWNFFLQMATPLLWAKMADTIDYGKWKTGIRLHAFTFSTLVFFLKLGIAVGGALAGWLLAYYGYQADTPQTPDTQAGLLISFTLYPAVGSLLVAIVMGWYRLDSTKLEQHTTEAGFRAG